MDSFIEKALANISTNQDMGASELSLEAISTFKLYISRHNRLDQTSKDFSNDLKLLGKRLCQLRPSIRSITNKVDLFLNSIPSCPNRNIDTLKKELLIIIDTIIQEAQNAKNKIQENAAKVLADLTCLLIHSYSSTLIHVLKTLASKTIFVTESRPLCEGVKTAEILSQLGHEVILITDMESGYFLPQCEALCVGADAFFLDGTLINKMGSCILGLAAKEMNIPFYVISETDKMIYSAYSREKIELEEKSKHEVYPNQAQFKIRNIYFDITAPEYIAGFITEKGVYRADQLGDLVS